MFSSSPKTSWDKRAWLLGLFLGNFAGLLLLCGGHPTSRRFLESAFPYSAFGYYTGDFVIWLGAVLGALIFPAVLTCLARRLYVLWALLPLCLFTIWFVAGEMVAHNISRLSDPPWAFPLAALMCWAIASLPISLFRFLRQRFRRRAASTPNPAPKRPLLHWAGLAALLTPVLALVILGWYNLKHPREVHANIESHFLGGREARIPLVEKNGGIFVMASLNGQEQLCKIDTGFDSVEWTRDLNISGKLTDERGSSCDSLNNCVNVATVKLPYIKIGTYEVTDLPTEMLDGGSLFSPPPHLLVNGIPLLGNSLFALTVLTIDYRNRVLVVRPPTYDMQKRPKRSGDRVLQMGWSYHNDDGVARQQIFGWPVIRASVNGKSLWCVIDSGWEKPDLGLAEEFSRSVTALQRVPRHRVAYSATHGASTVPELQRLRFQLPCLSPPHAPPIVLEDKGLIVKAIGGGEGVIGMHLMTRYRITIDYERGHVLLEPYAQDGPGHKQEKPRPKAKQAAI